MEDSPTVTSSIKTYFSRLNDIEIIGCAGTVDDALEIMQRRYPDVILLDLIMPGADGFCMLEQFHKNGVNIPNIIVLSAIGEEEIIKRLSGRRMCPSTGRTYHILFNPPKVEGLDDETGEPLIQRDDDKPEAIRHRLELYNEATAPLIDYYKAKDVVLDLICTNDPKETEDNFFAIIKDRK